MKIKFILKYLLCAWLFSLVLLALPQAQASVVIAGTRVIYNQKDRDITVKLSNNGRSPALVQAWIDKGDPKALPSTIDVPFTVTPPVSRIDSGKGQTLRIILSGEPPARDRESVYWLNVLEIPPKPEADVEGQNALQIAIRTRIKLFYRPDGLNGRPEHAPEQISWRLTTKDGQPALEAHNSSAYYVSFAKVEIADGNAVATADDGMVGPGETMIFPLKGEVPPGSPSTKVRYEAINDYGASVAGEASLR